MFYFSGLKALHHDMKKVGESRTVFPFSYNGKGFSCIFLIDMCPFRLYITTLGEKSLIFELEIEKGYKVKSYLDDYKKLVAYLDLTYDPNHKFIPNDFFKALDIKIPNKFKEKPNYKDVLRIASKKRKIEEIDKIYFCGWRRNSVGEKVSQENLEKTRTAFGDEKAELCRIENVSSRWTDIDTEENLKRLNDICKL